MSLAPGHGHWLHLNFPVPARQVTSCASDAMAATFSYNLRGRRVWTKFDVVDTSRGTIAAAANCGGTVAFHDADDDMTVRWDNGSITLHPRDELLRNAFLIGGHKTLQDHIDCLANRCQCKSRNL